MSCDGCSVDDRDAVAVFVCASCVHSRGGKGRPGMVRCSVNGVAIVEQVCGGVLKARAGMACPKGKGPDADGLVRHWWMRWRGVPLPTKLRLRFAWKGIGAPAPARWEDMPGCGCVHVLKNAAERIAAWTRRDADGEWVLGAE